jgi:CelD/BcsL family acetyltransferase involved in cellulose biosynthesis
VVRGEATAKRFREFVQLHNSQWGAAGRSGHFGDWPESTVFNQELVERLAKKDRVRLYVLTDGDDALAIQYTFILGKRCYWRLPARRYTPELEKLGIGRLGLLKMIEALIGEDVCEIEAGPGHYDYKIRHGGIEHSLRSVVVSRSTAKSRWRTKALVLWADILHLAYYRVWFLKVTSAIPQLQGRLWNAWIRTRL